MKPSADNLLFPQKIASLQTIAGLLKEWFHIISMRFCNQISTNFGSTCLRNKQATTEKEKVLPQNDVVKRSRISMGLIQQMIKNRILTLLLKTKAATLIGERQNTRLKMDKARQFCGRGASGRKMKAS